MAGVSPRLPVSLHQTLCAMLGLWKEVRYAFPAHNFDTGSYWAFPQC